MTPQQLYESFSKLDIEKIAIEAMTETSDARADYNVMQMIQGLRSDGSEITPSYSRMTIEIKKLKGQPTDRVTLRDTGAFQAEMYSRMEGLKVITGSNDPKEGKLEKKYSKAKGSIFGLSEKIKEEYVREDLGPLWKAKIEKATGLKMK